MAKGKMPPQLLEYFKKKVGKSDEKDSEKEDKGAKAEESAKKGLKAAKSAKKFKDNKGKDGQEVARSKGGRGRNESPGTPRGRK